MASSNTAPSSSPRPCTAPVKRPRSTAMRCSDTAPVRATGTTWKTDAASTASRATARATWSRNAKGAARWFAGPVYSLAPPLLLAADANATFDIQNCAIKPPAPVALRERHRRLCTTCARAPLATFLGPHLDTCASLGSEAVHRAICSCDTRGVWLCQPCGRGIRNTDHEYQQYASLASALVGEDGLVQLTQCHFKLSRIWHWRSHYGETLGGLGTGIGDGDRGVTCGRERRCLAAREIEHEVDCDAEDARWYGEPWSTTTSGSPPVSAAASYPSAASAAAANHSTSLVTAIPMAPLLFDGLRHDNERAPSPQLGPGYERHEIEGIGGRVKRKLVRMVRVGACVPEGVDETGSSSRVLGPEVRGDARSWCGWCWRVIPGRRDEAMFGADAQSTGGRRVVVHS